MEKVGPTEIRYSMAWSNCGISRRYLFLYSVVSVNRNIVTYNKYLPVITLIAVFVIVIVISLEHCTVVIGLFKFKF